MKKMLSAILTAISLCLPLAACDVGPTSWGDRNTGSVPPTSTNADEAKTEQGDITFPADETEAEYSGGLITTSGVYAVRGEITQKISVQCDEPVELKFYDVTLSTAKKAIEAEAGTGDLIITLSGENRIQNSDEEGKSGIDIPGDLLIRGEAGARLTMNTTGHAIKANSVTVEGVSLDLTSQKDGLHAEIARYDLASFEGIPTPSFADGGFVHLKDADVTIAAGSDGIQADTFVRVEGETDLKIAAGGGAPEKVTAASSNSASGKGVKAGALDYGANGTQLAWEDSLILIEGGTLHVDANDDAFHSEGELVLTGGELTVASGDDGMHAKSLLSLAGGKVHITRCYEGVEAAKVEIFGGELDVNASDDGVNAADGIENIPGQKNAACRILIAGGKTTVVSSGDGVDSNGDFIMTGGTLFVTGPSSGDNTALDADGETRIDGGYLLAVGCAGMMGSSPSNTSKQNVIVYTHASNLNVSKVYIADMGGTEIFSYTPARAFSRIVLSCPELAAGSTYSLYAGEQTLAENIQIASAVTTLGSQQGGFGPGGQGGWGGGWGGPGGHR